MRLAQGYQDLTGQILRGVIRLVDEVEVALVDLLRLSGSEPASRETREARDDGATPPADLRRGVGPRVPGIAHGTAVNAQQDVDDLLSGLGV